MRCWDRCCRRATAPASRLRARPRSAKNARIGACNRARSRIASSEAVGCQPLTRGACLSRKASNAASSQISTPSSCAFASLLPAASPATTNRSSSTRCPIPWRPALRASRRPRRATSTPARRSAPRSCRPAGLRWRAAARLPANARHWRASAAMTSRLCGFGEEMGDARGDHRADVRHLPRSVSSSAAMSGSSAPKCRASVFAVDSPTSRMPSAYSTRSSVELRLASMAATRFSAHRVAIFAGLHRLFPASEPHRPSRRRGASSATKSSTDSRYRSATVCT